MSFYNISHTHETFIHNISHLVELETYEQACKNPTWIELIKIEIDALEVNKTCPLVCLPYGHRYIGCKWVFEIKYNSNGTVERYKVPPIAKGLTQQEGIDYNEYFAPIIKFFTL